MRISDWSSDVCSSDLRPRSPADYVATVVSQAGISIPDFWMAILGILVFARTLQWLPASRYVPLSEDPVGWLEHLILPAVHVGVVSGSVLTRFVRSSVLEAHGRDQPRTPHPTGPTSRVVYTAPALRP